MRHRVDTRKLGRTASHRVAMYRNLVTSLLEHERIETTDAKAKELRRIADRMITLGKRGDLHARRQALRVIRQREVAAKVFGELAERFRERAGGYTRVMKTRLRPGDAASLSIVELVEPLAPLQPAAKKGRKKTGEKAASRKAPSRKAAAEKSTGRKSAAGKAATRKAAAEKAAPTRAASKKGSRRASKPASD
jgi:large subunit ribosomal protein L17